MSALPIDERCLATPSTPWRQVEPASRPRSVNQQEVAPSADLTSRSGSVSGAWQLTERGIAVVLSLFATLFLAGIVVLVMAFLAVPDEPLARDVAAPAVAALR